MARLLALALLLAACAGPSGQLPGDAAVAASTWLALDLATRRVQAVDPTDLDLGAACWRDRMMLFRRLAAGSYPTSGAALGPVRTGVDEPAAAAAPACWMGVFEVTVAQWRRIVGGPGPDLPGDLAALAGNAPAQPVTAVAPARAARALAACRPDRFHLRLPGSGAWTAACAGGNARLFAWGDGTDRAIAATYAHVRGDGAAEGLLPVGSLMPAATGFCDMHGNAWEVVDDGDDGFAIRGGAWDLPVLQARTCNRLAIPGDLEHPTVGLRLVLAP